jgi:uncharacterized protein YjbJ (UPF0337 family)
MTSMNDDTIKGQWKQLVGEAKRQWGKLTDDDLLRAEGDLDKLTGSVQERYGVTRDEAHHQVKTWRDKASKAADKAGL